MSRGRMIRRGATDDVSARDTVDLDDNTGVLVNCRPVLARKFLVCTAQARWFAGLPTSLLAIGLWLASAAAARADGQIWVLASLTKTVAVNWRVGVDVAPRWERDASDYSRTVLRAQIARVFGERVALGFGYEFTEPASFVALREHRIWQQVQVQQRVGAWTLSHRGRLEQRWLRFAPSTVVRTRYQFRAAHPIAHSRRWSWLVLDEVLYTLRGTRLGPAQGLDRHRLGGGVSRALSDHVTVEAGYTWQFINRQRPLPDQHDHFAVFTLLARY